MVPKHNNPTRKDRTAVAPYNFVPIADPTITFPDDERNPLAVDQSRYHPGRRTGWIDVTLTTRSPLYIRGSLKPEDHQKMEKEEKGGKENTPHLEKVRNRPDFFQTGNGEPVIPGSSLRGMIRQMVEILGHGKLKPVMKTPLVYRAVGDTSSHGEAYRKLLMQEDPDSTKRHHYEPLFEAGYIRYNKETGEWFIQPAQKTADGASYARINHRRIPQRLDRWHTSKNAEKIFVQFGPREYQEVRGGFLHVKYAKVFSADNTQTADASTPAVLVRSGHMFSKRTEAVFMLPDEQAEWIIIPDGSDETDPRDLVTAYRDQISPEQEKLLGRDGVLVNHQPVFYLMQNSKLLFFFGHTQMFRMPYPYSPQEMLPSPHWNDDRIDFAEAMFGKARGQQESGIAGRVFVSDACLHKDQDKNDLWLSENPVVIPKVLSSPKPTTFQHYLTQSKPDLQQGKGLHTYNSDSRQSTLRGFKLYWHKGKQVRRGDYAENEKDVDQKKDKIHTKIKPVKEDVRFSFRIHFENLLPAELGLLWWALALPVADGQEYCHKLGMGKPLGLGAVKLVPELHLVELGNRYGTLFDDAQVGWEQGTAVDLVEQVKTEAVENFEQFILKRSKLNESRLADTRQVQMLLAMLAWPGPNPAKTRYMEIEYPDPSARRGKRNEYRERPVLPDPLHVK